jgi:hypothetical protein
MKKYCFLLLALFSSTNCYSLQKKDPSFMASVGAWASLAALTASGAFVSYKTLTESLDTVFSRVPLVNRQHEYIATIASRSIFVPCLALWSLRYSKLAWYFFYVFYSGEHISPQLAYDAINDLKIYVQHLNTIKEVQRELNAVILEINEAVSELESAKDVGNDQGVKKTKKTAAIDPDIIEKLSGIIASNQAYVSEIVNQLREIFPNDGELGEAISALLQNAAYESFSQKGGSFLQEQAQAVVDHIQSGGKNLGYDAKMLNKLVKSLIEYWQKYTIGLAESIDAVLKRCHTVHAIEQFIVTTLDVPLSLV